MKALRTWLLALFLMGCVLATPALAADTVASGTCGAEGDNLTWTLDSEGVLTISGAGAMKDFYTCSDPPWYANIKSIKTVSIGSGVTSIGKFSFNEASNLVNVIIPDSVTSIGKSAFENCSGMVNAAIPNGVTTIGEYAFYGCSSLSGVTIPDGVTSISNFSFYACSSLSSLTLGSGLTSIGSSAFRGCSGLTDITIPDSVTSIGDSAFSNCSSLNSLMLGSGVTSIGSFAFQDCSSLTDVTIPDSVTGIGGAAFSGCSSLTGIIIPNGVTNIDGSTFSNCSSLSSLTLGSGVTSISGWAFQGCSSLTSITIPDSVTSIGSSAFSNCGSLSSLTLGGGVTSIGRYAFHNCNNLGDVNVTSMDAWCRIAFEDSYATPGCYARNFYLNGEKVASVAVPQGVTALNYTFYGFKDLIRVTLPDSLTSIGGYAFGNCSSLVTISIPNSVTSVGRWAFYGCSSLTRITIGSGVTSIERDAFSSCSSLSDVYLTDMDAWCRITFGDLSSMPTRYAKNIYLKGEKITSVTMPQGITAVQNYTFYGFPDLATVTIPDSVTSIERDAFSNCRSLASITIPDSVASIGADVFEKCTSLQSITIGSGVTSIGDSAFYNCNKLESVYITNMAAWCGITFASKDANPLYYAKNLYLNGAKVETLEIPEGVQVISSYAFVNAACIQGVAIPKSLVGVAANAFTGCESIAKVYYAGSETEWKDLAISAGNDPLTSAEIFYNATADDYYCRITVKISDGGRIFVDRNMAAEGETVTITTAPYAGYELSALYVDGAAIEGNTFTVTGNHVVSALFTKLPVTGGTQDYRLEGITVQTAEGEKLQELTAGKLLVSVSVRHLQGTEGATILLAQYDAQGRYQGLLWLTLDEMPLDMALKVTLPVDNSDGKIVHLKAFVVDSLLSAVPVGSAVSFGDV